MSFVFTCPHCGRRTRIQPQHAGRSGHCVDCGREITVPFAATMPARQPPSAAARRSHRWLLAATLAAALIAMLGVGYALVAYVSPSLRALGSGSDEAECRARLKRIGEALRAYHDDFGSFPPAYVADDAGKPRHSWRVLLLPYLGESALYERYRFDEPWDSPANLELAGHMPAVYESPSDVDALASGETSFLVVVGPATAFPGAATRRLDEIRDGAENTVLVVESQVSGVCWLEPRDIPLERFEPVINGSPGRSIGSMGRPPLVVLASGEVKKLNRNAPPEFLLALVTALAQDPLDWTLLERN